MCNQKIKKSVPQVEANGFALGFSYSCLVFKNYKKMPPFFFIVIFPAFFHITNLKEIMVELSHHVQKCVRVKYGRDRLMKNYGILATSLEFRNISY